MARRLVRAKKNAASPPLAREFAIGVRMVRLWRWYNIERGLFTERANNNSDRVFFDLESESAYHAGLLNEVKLELLDDNNYSPFHPCGVEGFDPVLHLNDSGKLTEVGALFLARKCVKCEELTWLVRCARFTDGMALADAQCTLPWSTLTPRIQMEWVWGRTESEEMVEMHFDYMVSDKQRDASLLLSAEIIKNANRAMMK